MPYTIGRITITFLIDGGSKTYVEEKAQQLVNLVKPFISLDEANLNFSEGTYTFVGSMYIPLHPLITAINEDVYARTRLLHIDYTLNA